jgi:hypothetical protein
MNAEAVKILNDLSATVGVQGNFQAERLDYADFERVLFAMVLRQNSIADEILPDYFRNENLGMLVEISKNIRARGEKIDQEILASVCDHLGLARLKENIPKQAWFTVANKNFYIKKLKERYERKIYKARLLDELRALNEEV